MTENTTAQTFQHVQSQSSSNPSNNQTFFSSKTFGEDLKLSLSVSQHQSQSQQYLSPNTESASKYLLKLWIEKRLEQIRNTSSTESVTSTRTCPEVYLSDPQEALLCSLWAEFNDLQLSAGLMSEISTTGFQHIKCVHELDPTSSAPLCKLWCAVLYSCTKDGYAVLALQSTEG